MKKLATAISTIIAMTVSLLLVPAPSALASVLTIASPEDGTSWSLLDTLPVRLSVSEVDPLCPTLEVHLYDGGTPETTWTWNTTTSLSFARDVDIVDQLGPGWSKVEVTPVLVSAEACTLGGSADFFVRDATVEITSVAPDVFYPLVRDGYRDVTTVRWKQSNRGRVLVQVHRVSDGSLARKVGLGTLSAGRHAWKWNGRDGQGEVVKPGKYDITVRWSAGVRRSDTARVVVDTMVITDKKTLTKNGTNTSARSWSAYVGTGGCSWTAQGGSLLSSCLYARASLTYSFSVPANASITNKSVERRSDTFPCLNDSVSMARSGSTVRLTFTHGNRDGFSRCWVDRVVLGYTTSRRI